MTKDEALRLALEVLEFDSFYGTGKQEVIIAIKAALEAKDEPVDQPQVRTGNCLRVGVCASEGHKIQPQRTWVGLTDEHKEGLICMTNPNPEPHHLRELIDVVEFQLKEKNT